MTSTRHDNLGDDYRTIQTPMVTRNSQRNSSISMSSPSCASSTSCHYGPFCTQRGSGTRCPTATKNWTGLVLAIAISIPANTSHSALMSLAGTAKNVHISSSTTAGCTVAPIRRHRSASPSRNRDQSQSRNQSSKPDQPALVSVPASGSSFRSPRSRSPNGTMSRQTVRKRPLKMNLQTTTRPILVTGIAGSVLLLPYRNTNLFSPPCRRAGIPTRGTCTGI